MTARPPHGAGLLLSLALLAGPAAASGQAVLGGVVVDEVTGVPVPGATISFPDLGLHAVADTAGRFFLDRLPVGTHDVRFVAEGYVTVVEEVELTETEFFQVRMSPVAAAIDELMVIVGREPGSPEAVAAPLPGRSGGSSVRTVLNLLEDRVPGVVVRRGGGIGGGAAIYLRGVSTFQLETAPDIYLDGARISQASEGVHVLDRIPAEDVARIRVLRGAASGPPLGSANGAIVIETVRGGSER